MSDSLYKKWKADTEELIDLYYNKQISFNGDTTKINLGGSVTLTDSNGVLKYYPTFSKTINKVAFSHTKGENKLNISVASDCTTHSVSFNLAHRKYIRIYRMAVVMMKILQIMFILNLRGIFRI